MGKIDNEKIEVEPFCEIVEFTKDMPFRIVHHNAYSSRPVRSHWHPDLEIDMLDKGDGKIDFYVEGRHETLTENGVVLINGGEVHSSFPDMKHGSREIVGVTLIVKYDFLKMLVPDFDNIFWCLDTEKDKKAIAGLISRMSETYLEEKNKESFRCMLISGVCEIVSYLCENCMHERESFARRDNCHMRVILDYIHNNYQLPLTQEMIAQEFYFSRGYFSCFFKKYTGKTFKKYLTEVRLIQAERLLRETSFPVCRIAQDVGFNDERRFIENFKKSYGMTPGCFRKSPKISYMNERRK